MKNKENNKKSIKRSGLGEKGIYKTLRFVYTALASAIIITVITLGFSLLSAFSSADFSQQWDLNPVIELIITICGIIVVTVLLLDFLGRKLFKPINDLTKATKKISQGDYSVRVGETAFPEELKELTKGFNKMAGELAGTEILRNDFVSNFSHEFKTPIVSVKGFAKQLKNKDLSEKQREEYIDIIIDASERLANLSSEILLLSKYESTEIVTDKEEFYLDEQLRTCIVLLEKQWSEKNIDLDLDLDEIKYFFNRDMLFRVWTNIIINAIKFSNINGVIHISCKKDKKNIVVHIRDEGKGMDNETAEHIFEKFYQGDRSHLSKGNGLGLCLAKRVVDLCNGTVTVESEIGKGTDFCIKLPINI